MTAGQDCGIALPHPTHQYRTSDRVWVCPGVSTGKDQELHEHVILVGFEVAATSSQRAQALLLTLLGQTDGENLIAYWIAEDDRIDGTDNDSAVFVPKGEQQATTDLLTHRTRP